MTMVVVSQAMALFLTLTWMNDVLKSASKAIHVPKSGIARARAFFVNVEAHVAANPSLMKERAKAIFFWSVS